MSDALEYKRITLGKVIYNDDLIIALTRSLSVKMINDLVSAIIEFNDKYMEKELEYILKNETQAEMISMIRDRLEYFRRK